MKKFAVGVWFALGLGSAGNAQAQREVTLVAPGGIRAAIEQLTPGFERKTGIKLKATFGSGLGTKQVVRGEPFDMPEAHSECVVRC